MKVLLFTWNTQSVKLCETDSETQADINRSGYRIFGFPLTTWQYSCSIPDFWNQLADKIKQHDPDIIVIGFQEDRHPGSYFHSHFLPAKMPELGYSLIKRTKMLGFGRTTVDNLKYLDPMRRGIRCSIYCRDLLKIRIEFKEISLRAVLPLNGQEEFVCASGFGPSSLIRGKGATISYLCVPDVGTVAFVCTHLPFTSKTLIDQKVTGDDMIRQTELNSCNGYFNSIIEHVLHHLDGVNHIFFFGDMNYRISSSLSAASLKKKLEEEDEQALFAELYNKYDELHEQMSRGNIYKFSEGVDGVGPRFEPTYKLDQQRKWKLGRFDQRVPSWCDRILYRDHHASSHTISCSDYERFDHGATMAQSDHAAVLGVYDFVPRV